MNSKVLSGLFATTILLTGCAETEEPTEKETPVKETESSVIDKENFDAMIVPRIDGGSFVESIDVQGNEVTITYFDDFESYKAEHPESNVDEEMYKSYWGSGDAIEKALFKGVSDLMEKEPKMMKLNMNLPYEGKEYAYSVERAEVEEYIGADEYDDSIRKEFINKFIGKEITADNVQ